MLVYEDGSFAAEYTYDSNGNRIMLSYANDNITTYLYNYANLVTSLTNENDQGIVSDYTYDYYLDGNQRRKIEDSGKVTVYTYDDLGRLTSEAVTEDGETNTLSYTYDDSSNRATMTSVGADAYTVSYDYDLNNRLLAQSKIQGTNEELIEYYYDPNGNQTAKNTSVYTDSTAEESFELTAGEIEQYEYNAIDQLIASSVDGVSATYTYQPDGLRLTKTAGANTTQFVWDGMNLALELDETDAYTSKYIRGTNAIYREDAAGAKQHYLYNAHGDVVQLTDNDGDVTKTYVYDAFGNELNPNPTDANPLRYAGEYYDAETGTYYLRARYYDAAIGRFIGEDALQDGLNWYVYCANNPIMFIDPSGNSGILADGSYYITHPLDEQLLRLKQEYEVASAERRDAIAQEAQAIRDSGKEGIDWSVRAGFSLDRYIIDRDITTEFNDLMKYVGEKHFWRRFKAITKSGDITRHIEFAWMVRPGGIYDLKSKKEWQGKEHFIYEGRVIWYDDPGNILYGYLGKAMGFEDHELLIAAGAVQILTCSSKLEYVSSFFDDPRDQMGIAEGIVKFKMVHNRIWW